VGTGTPGPRNSIADVAGVRVGATTLIEGEAVRTGVTVIVPPEEPLFAGCHRLNGNGELTGLEWVRESGTLTTPIGLTSTLSVGVVRDALASADTGRADDWALAVAGETWDGTLNDIGGRHIRPEHVAAARAAASEEVAEGNVGGGTGMICHGFKGGTGTASRLVDGWTVGVLVQANHGARRRLAVNGIPVGRHVGPNRVPLPGPDSATGSIIVIAATDAPLLPFQCDRLAQRTALGVARAGGAGENGSGDLMLAFATGNRGLAAETRTIPLTMLRNESIDRLFHAAIEATEEAILNALVAAETLAGRNGVVAHALPHDLLQEAMQPRRR
jgi:D-aminopeptidase